MRDALTGRLCPQWLEELLRTVPIVGTEWELEDHEDHSGMGVDMQFLSTEEMIDEATAVYPGIIAHKLGYLPLGSCLTGSGDYYYLDLRKAEDDDPPIVRLPHDAVVGGTYREEKIEIVAVSFGAFIDAAAIA
ncbi:MAG: SMI1/KNR4 family protein [Pseudomonadota bacterium]